MFHLLKEECEDATCHIQQAMELYSKFDSTENLIYCKVQKEFLNGCCLACKVSLEGHTPTLTQRLHTSIKDQYIVSIISMHIKSMCIQTLAYIFTLHARKICRIYCRFCKQIMFTGRSLKFIEIIWS